MPILKEQNNFKPIVSDDDSCNFLDAKNHTPTKSTAAVTTNNKPSSTTEFFTTPTKSILVGPTTSPTKSLSENSLHSYEHTHHVDDSDDEFEASTQIKQIWKSDHKIAEEMGHHVEEPLLKENPHRFVLFPIEDNEVSIDQSVLFGYQSSVSRQE